MGGVGDSWKRPDTASSLLPYVAVLCGHPSLQNAKSIIYILSVPRLPTSGESGVLFPGGRRREGEERTRRKNTKKDELQGFWQSSLLSSVVLLSTTAVDIRIVCLLRLRELIIEPFKEVK